MEVYSKDATPRVDKVSGKNYYEGATSYKAADINDVENSVQTVIGDLTVEIESAVTNFDKLIQELDENFGVKFIKLKSILSIFLFNINPAKIYFTPSFLN